MASWVSSLLRPAADILPAVFRTGTSGIARADFLSLHSVFRKGNDGPDPSINRRFFALYPEGFRAAATSHWLTAGGVSL